MHIKGALSLLTLVAAFNLQGCVALADAMSKAAGIGVVKEEKSTFDDATIVSMSPAFLYSGEGMGANSIQLGARWSSKHPSYVTLVPSYNSDVNSWGSAYTNISSMDININGEISSFNSSGQTQHNSSSYNSISKTIYTESKGAVVVPFSVLEQMMSSKDCRIRIHSSDGYEDSIFSVDRIPGGQATAKFALKEFMDKVKTLTVASQK